MVAAVNLMNKFRPITFFSEETLSLTEWQEKSEKQRNLCNKGDSRRQDPIPKVLGHRLRSVVSNHRVISVQEQKTTIPV
jgi:hypothetical protein